MKKKASSRKSIETKPYAPFKAGKKKAVKKEELVKTEPPKFSILSQAKEDSVCKDTAPHVVIEARAGTGKTTTLVAALHVLQGNQPKDHRGNLLVPSPQQQAVWDIVSQSKGKVQTVAFVAFGNAIAAELQTRVPEGYSAMTIHSMGYAAVRQAFNDIRFQRPSSWRVNDLIGKVFGIDPRELWEKEPDFISATKELVKLCKMNLIHPWDTHELSWEETIGGLAAHYDVDMGNYASKVCDTIPKVLELCKKPREDRKLDFDDMIWLPVALDLPLFKYDMLMVDEAQDLNKCQQAIVKRAGSRLIFCGDPMQAIYGFAGADTESMYNLMGELSTTDRGCVHLPLTVTRRCGKLIVEEAQKIVNDFEAHEGNPVGAVHTRSFKEGKNWYIPEVQYGDRVICRVNAPLVSQCFKFLAMGKKAIILGREVAKTLKKLISKMEAEDVTDLILKLETWKSQEQAKESAKKQPDDMRLITIQDTYDCLCVFCEDKSTVEAVLNSIDAIFAEEATDGIILSSIHKVKGLEADRVFLLEPKGATVPHPMAKSQWQREQEYHLRYVAITRARKELFYVGDRA